MTESTVTQLPLDVKLPPKPKGVKKATKEELARIAGAEGAFTVPFDSIKVSTNIRATPTEGLAELAESIRTTGLQTPLAIRVEGEDTILETGHRRYLALRALGLKDHAVPVHLVTNESEGVRVHRQWAENSNRVALSPLDEARTINRLIELEELTVAAVANVMQMDRKTVTNRRCLLSLPPEGIALLEGGEWQVEAAQEAGRLTKQGYPAPENLVGRNIHYLDRVRDEWNQEKTFQSWVKNLQARGVTVVINHKLGPAPDGFRTDTHARLKVENVKDIKALEIKDLETVKDEDDNPALYVAKPQWYGADPVVWTLQVVELGSSPNAGKSPHAITTNMVESRHEARQEAALEALADKGDDLLDESMVWRLALHGLVTRAWSIDLRRLGLVGGVGIGDHRPSDGRHIADMWFKDPAVDGKVAQRMVQAVILMLGCRDIKGVDGAYSDERLEEDLANYPTCDWLLTNLDLEQPTTHDVLLKAHEENPGD